MERLKLSFYFQQKMLPKQEALQIVPPPLSLPRSEPRCQITVTYWTGALKSRAQQQAAFACAVQGFKITGKCRKRLKDNDFKTLCVLLPHSCLY